MKLLLRIVISAFLLAGLSVLGYSQDPSVHIKKLLMLVDDVRFTKVINPDSTLIEGTPFLDKEYINGTITTPGGEEYIEIPLRYNVYNDNFEFRREDKAYSLEAEGFAGRATLGSRIFLYMSYSYKNRVRDGYLELVSGGVFNLYKRYRTTYDLPKEPQPYTEAIPGKFKSLTPFLLISYGDKKPETIQSEKQLIEISRLAGINIKPFLKENKIKVRREEDVIKVVEYLNANL